MRGIQGMFWRFLKGSQVDCIKVKEGVTPLSVGHQAVGRAISEIVNAAGEGLKGGRNTQMSFIYG